jgi:hypothetical protein
MVSVVDLAVAATRAGASAAQTPPFTATIFPDVTGRTAQVWTLELATLVTRVASLSTYAAKSDCPLIKLARFGEQRTAAGSLRHDGLLILDELSQMDPREAGEAAYLLANGRARAALPATAPCGHRSAGACCSCPPARNRWPA